MTTYAPKFPEVIMTIHERRITRVNPLDEYKRLTDMRNAKVSIGMPLSYHSDSPKVEPKQLMTYVSRVSVPQLDNANLNKYQNA